MKKLIHCTITLSICALLGACSVSSPSSTMVGKPAPLTHFFTLDGSQVSLDSYRKSTVVLLFWAQWCSRSQSIIREIAEFADSHPRNVRFVAVDIDKVEKLDALKTLINEAQLQSLDHMFSGNDVYDEAYAAFDVGEVPTVFILTPDGRVVRHGTSFSVLEEYFKLD